jgi:hypothetical protein
VSILRYGKTYAGMFITPLADYHQVGHMNGGFLRKDSSFYVLLRIRLGVLMYIVQALNNRFIIIQKNLEHFACFASVFPGQHVNQITFLYMHSGHFILVNCR